MKHLVLICGMSLMSIGSAAQADDAVPQQAATACQSEAQINTDECLVLPPVGQAAAFVAGLSPDLTTALIISLVAAAADGGSTSTPSATP